MTADDSQPFDSTVYYDADADPEALAAKTVAVLGYGSQGHAHAQNLADSGIDVVVGLREDSSSRAAAEGDGLRVETPADAVADADIVSVLVPDTVQPDVYENAIEPNLEAGDTLSFEDVRARFLSVPVPDPVLRDIITDLETDIDVQTTESTMTGGTTDD